MIYVCDRVKKIDAEKRRRMDSAKHNKGAGEHTKNNF
jgi:hypothetical protein